MEAGVTLTALATVEKYKFAALALLNRQAGFASFVIASYGIPPMEGKPIVLLMAPIASHKIVVPLAEIASPGHSFVAAGRFEAVRLLAGVALDVAAFEPALLAGRDGAHAKLLVASHIVALEAEEVEEGVGALPTVTALEEPIGELMAEYEELGSAVFAFDQFVVGAVKQLSAGEVCACHFIRCGLHTLIYNRHSHIQQYGGTDADWDSLVVAPKPGFHARISLMDSDRPNPRGRDSYQPCVYILSSSECYR